MFLISTYSPLSIEPPLKLFEALVEISTTYFQNLIEQRFGDRWQGKKKKLKEEAQDKNKEGQPSAVACLGWGDTKRTKRRAPFRVSWRLFRELLSH